MSVRGRDVTFTVQKHDFRGGIMQSQLGVGGYVDGGLPHIAGRGWSEWVHLAGWEIHDCGVVFLSPLRCSGWGDRGSSTRCAVWEIFGTQGVDHRSLGQRTKEHASHAPCKNCGQRCPQTGRNRFNGAPEHIARRRASLVKKRLA